MPEPEVLDDARSPSLQSWSAAERDAFARAALLARLRDDLNPALPVKIKAASDGETWLLGEFQWGRTGYVWKPFAEPLNAKVVGSF